MTKSDLSSSEFDDYYSRYIDKLSNKTELRKGFEIGEITLIDFFKWTVSFFFIYKLNSCYFFILVYYKFNFRSFSRAINTFWNFHFKKFFIYFNIVYAYEIPNNQKLTTKVVSVDTITLIDKALLQRIYSCYR